MRVVCLVPVVAVTVVIWRWRQILGIRPHQGFIRHKQKKDTEAKGKKGCCLGVKEWKPSKRAREKVARVVVSRVCYNVKGIRNIGVASTQ